MDYPFIANLLSSGKPLRIETESGRVFDVLHRDFVGFSLQRTSMRIGYLEDDQERFATVPLHTIKSARTKD